MTYNFPVATRVSVCYDSSIAVALVRLIREPLEEGSGSKNTIPLRRRIS